MTRVESPDLRAFVASLPPTYATSFTETAQAVHLQVAERRGDRAVVARFPDSRHPGTAVCIVADDRPGLLALISAALLDAGLDVVHAEAWTRTLEDGSREAVDAFWVRAARADGAGGFATDVDDAAIAFAEERLGYLLEHSTDLDARPRLRPGPRGGGSRVRFVENGSGALAELEVETEDRPGVLLEMARAIHRLGVQITRCQVCTEEGRAIDRFQIEGLGGRPITATQRLELQVRVLAAIDAAQADLGRAVG